MSEFRTSKAEFGTSKAKFRTPKAEFITPMSEFRTSKAEFGTAESKSGTSRLGCEFEVDVRSRHAAAKNVVREAIAPTPTPRRCAGLALGPLLAGVNPVSVLVLWLAAFCN
jgi:hypothetical protein